ncbi:hypothetical protein PMPD1_0836 [Paramixta manurensis]|uniref:DUF3592 domain-containing protein n=1 Tax=Paramixta manurensis TaxID=2740817 RepID=A0A6M8U584_9GAMM|nr:hypothetical protein PMPD1_0836 [Erwiniaceae bacterium PD-1]
MANIGLAFAIIVISCMFVFFFIVTKNTISMNRDNERIKNEGFKTEAVIKKTYPDKVQNIEGRTHIHLDVMFKRSDGTPVETKKDISILTFNSNSYRVGEKINIIVSPDDSNAIIVNEDNVKN